MASNYKAAILKATEHNRMLKWCYYHLYLQIDRRDRIHRKRIAGIRRRGCANVILIASSLPMWRNQGLYELLVQDKRFSVSIIIHPLRQLSAVERQSAVDLLRRYFDGKGIPYYVCSDDDNEVSAKLESLDPDILFYPQNYRKLFTDALAWEKFTDRLLCYNSYALLTVGDNWNYNADYNNIAWRYYHATELHLATARRLTYNKGRNVCVAGEPHADLFFAKSDVDPWKKIGDGKTRKRIIFAPHFRIETNKMLNRAAFLWLYDYMTDLAERYRDSIQIAFKPHPMLKTTLYNHPDWGGERTDAYYEKWATMENTQLETGGFIDLFKTSDAMIHNCGSFTGEYLFTSKPVLFASGDWTEIYRTADDFGLKCLALHYKAENTAEVGTFIRDTVLGNTDSMKEARVRFCKEFLTPPNGCTVAENMYNDIVKGIWL
ncbi:MAG: CDP-glycerol glycerophosphotransferase family protein [Candidatus Aphodosoma sp.]